MGKTRDIEMKVGVFVTVGLGLIMLAILLLGGAASLFSRTNNYHAHFPSVEGLVTGAKVVLGGLQVGTVQKVDFDIERKDIKITMQVQKRYEEWIRANSTVEILTQGVLGDKFISIAAGTQDQKILPSGAELAHRPTKDLSQFISKGDQLMVSLNSIAVSLDRLLKAFESKNRSEVFFEGMADSAKNLAHASKRINEELDHIHLKQLVNNLNGIVEKINNGTGTLGALVNDPGLYYDAKTLMGGANRNRIIRNLVRKTIKESEDTAADEDTKEQSKKP